MHASARCSLSPADLLGKRGVEEKEILTYTVFKSKRAEYVSLGEHYQSDVLSFYNFKIWLENSLSGPLLDN